MRLQTIRELRDSFSGDKQHPLSGFAQGEPTSLQLSNHDPIRRSIVRTISLPALKLLQSSAQKRSRFRLSFPYDLLSVGERFGQDASLKVLLHQTRNNSIRNILIPGSSIVGEDAQFWLRRGIRQLAIVDIWDRRKAWEIASPFIKNYFGTDVVFRHCPIESTPFEDASFDLIASQAVLEHVRNISAFCQETARILRPGGLAWHAFGPLYFVHGGDHCIATYGKENGYDHLLLAEKTYREKIKAEDYYKRKGNSDSRFWALYDQFSFLTASEYLRAFSQYFDILHLVVQISDEGLWFRDRCSEKWGLLRAAGITEEDLLIKGLTVILRKRSIS